MRILTVQSRRPAVPKVGRMVGRLSHFCRNYGKKSRARLASPQPRPTSPVNGAGGLTGCRDSAAPTQTISLRLDALSDTSVLVRLPAAKPAGQEARNGPPAPPAPSAPAVTKSGDRKMTVACEPVVSVLTEVAKLLQPGRCVT